MSITEYEAKVAVKRLRALLGITLEQASRIYRVPTSTLVSWLDNQTPIPPECLALISQTDASLKVIDDLFEEARLPDLVRRPAEVFGGQSALDWILGGRIREVADTYDEALYFQPD